MSLLLAELATEKVLDGRPDETSSGGAVEPSPPALLASLDFRDEVYQAQGMVMATLGISLNDAMARMRAHAYANNQDLNDLAADIVAGRTQLTP